MGELTKTEKTELMNCLLDMGQLLLESGAEISRVEDTLSRMAKAYGCTHIEVFAITSIISLSVEFPGEDVFTETRRIYFSSGTDFTRLENLNRISRSCCKNPLPVPELQKSLHQVASEEKHFETVLLGSILAAGGFTVFSEDLFGMGLRHVFSPSGSACCSENWEKHRSLRSVRIF